jgi:hypothetical protein
MINAQVAGKKKKRKKRRRRVRERERERERERGQSLWRQSPKDSQVIKNESRLDRILLETQIRFTDSHKKLITLEEITILIPIIRRKEQDDIAPE